MKEQFHQPNPTVDRRNRRRNLAKRIRSLSRKPLPLPTKLARRLADYQAELAVAA